MATALTRLRPRLALGVSAFAVFLLIRMLERRQSGLDAQLMSLPNVVTVGAAILLTALLPFRFHPAWMLMRAAQLAGFGYSASLLARLAQGFPIDWAHEPAGFVARTLPLALAGLAGGAVEFLAEKSAKEGRPETHRPPTYW